MIKFGHLTPRNNIIHSLFIRLNLNLYMNWYLVFLLPEDFIINFLSYNYYFENLYYNVPISYILLITFTCTSAIP